MINNANKHQLTYEDKEVTLIGTAHVSRESAEQVSHVIEQERPDTVFIELCESRYQSITQKKKWQETELIKVIREKKVYVLLSNLMLAYFQKRIGQKLGIRPGEEVIRAVENEPLVKLGELDLSEWQAREDMHEALEMIRRNGL